MNDAALHMKDKDRQARWSVECIVRYDMNRGRGYDPSRATRIYMLDSREAEDPMGPCLGFL